MNCSVFTSPPPQAHCTAEINWREVELPDAWPDRVRLLRNPRHVGRIMATLLRGKTQPVELPSGLLGSEKLPKYLLQEFHHLPNGNYSKSITRGYARSFDRVMLGSLNAARKKVATQLTDCQRVLDVGCGGGQLAAQLLEQGIPEVWGLEPSPYLLQYAAKGLPDLHCQQGVIEDSGFADQAFDGAAACFVFHEIPPRHADKALSELRRILKPGARLIILEPSPTQLRLSSWTLWQRYGWRGVYFRLLARRVFEPFVAAWHARAHAQWFADNGFELIEQIDHMPWQRWCLRRLP